MVIQQAKVELFGGLTVHVGGRAINRFQTQKTGLLLAYLALHPGKQFGRESVAELLWPGGERTAIRNRLNQAISSLRRQLHPPGSPAHSILVADHQSVAIHGENTSSDVAEFESAIKASEATTEAGDSAGALLALEQATALYRGDFLDGYDDPWANILRVQYRDQVMGALSSLIRLLAIAGRHDESIAYANRRLLMEPAVERNHRTLIRLYLRAGRPGSARAQYDEMARALEKSGRVPSEKARELLQQIESHGTASRSPEFAPASSPLRPTENPPTSGRPLLTSEWPEPPGYLGDCIGRESELESIEHQLGEGHRRWVTIVGFTGLGKTRLAIEFARTAVPSIFPKVAFFSSPPEGLRDSILTELAHALLNHHHPNEKRPEQLILALNQAGPMLLVIDNLMDLASDQLLYLRRMLNDVPTLSVLATAPQPLGLEGESVLALAPLGIPETPSEPLSLAELAKVPSVALFVDRAQSVKQDFQLTEKTAPAILEVVRQLEGLPLALELAASWARMITPSQMAEQIRSDLHSLTSRRKDVEDRHTSLHAALNRTWKDLSPELQDACALLAYLPGSWTIDTARAILENSNAHQIVADLVERAIVRSVPGTEPTEFEMLALFRTFANEQASLEICEKRVLRHGRYWVDRLKSLEELSYGRAIAAAGKDIVHYRLAADTVLRHFSLDQAIRYDSLAPYFRESGAAVEGSCILGQLAERAQNEPIDPARLGVFLCRYAMTLWRAAKYDPIPDLVERAESLFRASGTDHPAMMLGYITAAINLHRQAKFAEAVEIYMTGQALAEKLGDPEDSAMLYSTMGNSLLEAGDHEGAELAYRKGYRIGRETGDEASAAVALQNLGHLYFLQKKLPLARETVTEAFHAASKNGRPQSSYIACLTLAEISNAAGSFPESAEWLQKAYARRSAQWPSAAWMLPTLLDLAMGLGEMELAAQLAGAIDHFNQSTPNQLVGAARAKFEAIHANLREQLDPVEFELAFERGHRMGEEELEIVLDELEARTR